MGAPTAQERAQALAGKSRGSSSENGHAAMEIVKKKFLDPRVEAQIKGQVPEGLGRVITHERVWRAAITILQDNEYLRQCDPMSIVSSCVKAAKLGLIPDGFMGHAYMIPRRIKGNLQAQFQIGYRGIIQLLYRTDRCRARGRCVWGVDKFHPVEGTTPSLIHESGKDDQGFLQTSGDWDDLRAAYATALYPDGYRDHRVIDVPYIRRVRAVSEAFMRAERNKSYDSPWHSWLEAMVEKTALIKLSKQLPLSTEAQLALSRDDAIEAGVIGYQHALDSRGVIDTEFRVNKVGMPTGLVHDVSDYDVEPTAEADDQEPEKAQAPAPAPEPAKKAEKPKKPKDEKAAPVGDEPPPHGDDDIPFGEVVCPHPPAALENDGRCGLCGEMSVELPH